MALVKGLVYLPVLLPPLRKDMKAVTVAPGIAVGAVGGGFPSRTQRSGLVLAVGIKAFERAPDQLKVVSEFTQPGTALAGLAGGHTGVISQ